MNVAIPKMNKNFLTDAYTVKLSVNNETQKSFTVH